jgi:regulator of RNase E activity RraA
MAVGNRVFLERDLPQKDIMEAFKGLPAANVADCMSRLCALSSEIKLISKPSTSTIVGPALTVKLRPGDNLMLHKALNIAEEGDIIVVSNEGDRTQSLMGEIMVTYARVSKKVSGIVLDGPIRDYKEISEMDFYLYATGSTPGGPFKEGPGEVNVPISIGNVAIMPGDIILGDADGIIVIPKKDAKKVLEAAIEYAKKDSAKLEDAKNGTSKRDWVDKILMEKNIEIIEGRYIY